jgi:replication factor A1
MKISELQAGQGSVEVEAVVKELEEPKSINKYGRELRLRGSVLEDDSGSIKLTLWNDDVDKFQVGDKVKIENGYVNEFQGDKQLTAGKFGKIEKVGEGDVKEKTDSTTTAEEPEEAGGLPDSSSQEVAEESAKGISEDGTI